MDKFNEIRPIVLGIVKKDNIEFLENSKDALKEYNNEKMINK